MNLFTSVEAPDGILIKNNVFVASTGKKVLWVAAGNTTGHTINNNVWYGGSATPFNWSGTDYNFADYKAASSQDASSVNADPLFTSTVTPDFSLQASSPAINAGVDVGLTSDYAAATVPDACSSLYDIGSYEYQYDCTPSAFAFTDIAGATFSTVYTSNTVSVDNVDYPTTAISISGAGCTYNVNGGAYTSDAGTVANADNVTVRGTSSGASRTVLPTCELTIGGVSDTYTVETRYGIPGRFPEFPMFPSFPSVR
jgi:hypothetical protein